MSTPQLLVAWIGEMVVSSDEGSTLVAYGLGSCVALAAWDPIARVGGLAHFMLPSDRVEGDGPPVKSVDDGLPRFLDAFRSAGGHPARSRFRAAGGAAMLTVVASNLDIGRRNAEAVSIGLARLGLRLHASEVGGSVGRTVRLDVGSGRLIVKSLSSVSVL
jgi:chemotaxis protein CheD